jgi:hypothetical protein
MLKSTLFRRLALPLAFLLACASAQAQLKPPSSTTPKGDLGSGLGGKRAPKPAAAENKPAPETKPQTLDDVVQEIANCILAGLPAGWKLAQIEVIEVGRDAKQREFEAKYSYSGSDGKGAVFTPCDLREPARNVYKLNEALEPDKRNWTKATLVLSSEGKFELQYDYAKADSESGAPKRDAGATGKPTGAPDPNYDPTKK